LTACLYYSVNYKREKCSVGNLIRFGSNGYLHHMRLFMFYIQ